MSCASSCKAMGKSVRASIQRVKATATRDASNNIKYADDSNWETVGSRTAWIKTLGGSERFASDQLQAGHTYRVTMRSDRETRAITPDDRLRLNVDGKTRTLGIVSAVDKDFARQWVECLCVETRT